jgi:hypothetical protein
MSTLSTLLILFFAATTVVFFLMWNKDEKGKKCDNNTLKSIYGLLMGSTWGSMCTGSLTDPIGTSTINCIMGDKAVSNYSSCDVSNCILQSAGGSTPSDACKTTVTDIAAAITTCIKQQPGCIKTP